MARSAWTLLDELRIDRPHLHVHIVNKRPEARFLEDPLLLSFQHFEVFRRLNHLMEMIALIEDDGDLSEVSYPFAEDPENSHQASGVQSPEDLQSIATDMAGGIAILPHLIFVTRNQTKIGFVGYHTSDYYNQENRYGFQIRSIQAHWPSVFLERLLNAAHITSLKPEETIPISSLKKWLRAAKLPTNKFIKFAPKLSAHSSENILDLKALGFDEKEVAAINDFVEQRQEKKVEERKTTQPHLELNYLLHNWLGDPILVEHSKSKKERLLASQIRALRSLIEDPDDTDDVVRDFLLESGLYDLHLKSFNLARRE